MKGKYRDKKIKWRTILMLSTWKPARIVHDSLKNTVSCAISCIPLDPSNFRITHLGTIDELEWMDFGEGPTV
jgi:hypothetical protein